MIRRVGNIRKRGLGVTWITIKIEKIVVINHITREMKNKQINKQKEKF